MSSTSPVVVVAPVDVVTPGQGLALPEQPCTGCWVPSSNGEVPARAFAGGVDKEELVYVARAHSNGSLTPGKLLSSHGCAYVAWGGQERKVKEYEVLCDFSGDWKACSGKNIPSNALIAGQSEDGEPLYVGRVSHEKGLVLGKVQASHLVCYIPYGGEEKAFKEYEILVQDPVDVVSPGRGLAVPAQTCTGCWIPSSDGDVPERAFPGGEDKEEPVYVARAHFNGSLAPGKLLGSHGCAYVAWGGQERRVKEYEVLCDFRGEWKACSGKNIPSNALIAGQSEKGEPLYVGRVSHEHGLVLGKVQASHLVCYIPYGGEEKAFKEYEILVQSTASIKS